MKNISKEDVIDFLILAGRRALWTFAEVALSMTALGIPFSAMDWKGIFDVALGAAFISFLKSIVAGMPEFSNDGDLSIGEAVKLNLNIDEEAIKDKKTIRLKVNNEQK